MTFSIIMPCYNTKEYIKRAIDSVLIQSYSDWELIIIDDMSTDGSSELIDEIAKSNNKIKVIHNKVKRYAGGSRNAGLDIQYGDYVVFLDSDDELTSAYVLKEIWKRTLDTPDIIYMGYNSMGSYNNVFMPTRDNFMVENETLCAVWNKCWRADFIGYNRFDETLIFAEDAEFMQRMKLKIKKYEILSMPTHNYTTGREDSICARNARGEYNGRVE
jgi:glycosyltransferase involved in cell wall biosynthesis